MNCNEKELKAKLHNNRAIAHFKLGNHQNSLRDAEAAIELNPTFLKAIVRGATACVELKRFEEAITWCDKGLAVSFEGIFHFNREYNGKSFHNMMFQGRKYKEGY
ncbi:unnamed protein product [Pocillopora meandrina]|uniref:Uncharacterized protein n=1 Tax=Pocillopora meandrina TaxID=46732 RepID=A0AAU9XSV4_9CNID|nr:unnamed protein product [Pocillopora meandrina]